MEEAGLRQWLGAIGLQDQVAKLLLPAGERLLLLLLLTGEPAGDVQVDLTFVSSQVQNFERTERVVHGLPLALDLNEPLARGVDGELAEVGDEPLASQLLGNGSGRPAAAEEVGHKVALIAAVQNDACQQDLRLLSGVPHRLVVGYFHLGRDQRPSC